MKLNEMDLGTLAAVKAGLTRGHKDGTMLCDDEESIFFFTCEVAPDHWFYVELQTESTISISTGIFRRPIDYMRRMVRAEYAGLRIHRDRQRLAGEVNELVDSLASDDRPVYLAQMREYWRQDDAIAEQHGPF
jgi:hypothetical protein